MIVRAIDRYILRHPDGQLVVVGAGDEFKSTDALVKAHSWAFTSEALVEQATAAPGERRSVKRK